MRELLIFVLFISSININYAQSKCDECRNCRNNALNYNERKKCNESLSCVSCNLQVSTAIRSLTLGGPDVNCNTDQKIGDKCMELFGKGLRMFILKNPLLSKEKLKLHIKNADGKIMTKNKNRYTSIPITKFFNKEELAYYGYNENAQVLFYSYKLKPRYRNYEGNVTINLFKQGTNKITNILSSSPQKAIANRGKLW